MLKQYLRGTFIALKSLHMKGRREKDKEALKPHPQEDKVEDKVCLE